MSSLLPTEINEITQLIWIEKTNSHGLRPYAVVEIDEARFFDYHDNRYSGYFVKAHYNDNSIEIWFVVDLQGGLSDDNWHLEKIVTIKEGTIE